jgi:simple sugar transport system permease protein
MGVLIAFVAAVVRSGAALLPATLGAIVTERSGATNLGVEGVMLVGAMVGYAAGADSGSPVVGIVCAALAGGLLCVSHAVPVVVGRLSAERQFVLGLILVYLGDALSRLFGQPYVGHSSTAVDARFAVPVLSDVPVLGEMFFQQRAMVYWAYGLALAVWLVLYRTRLGLHLRAVGEEPSTADALGVPVDLYRFGAIVGGGLLMGFGGGVLSLSSIGAWTEGLTGGRGWIALGLVTFANWHPLWAVAGTVLFGGFEAAQFRLPPTFPGAQYLFGVLPYLAPIVTLPLITVRTRGRSAAPAAIGQPYCREARG